MKTLRYQMGVADPDRKKAIEDALKMTKELHDFLVLNQLGDFVIEVAGEEGELWWFSAGAESFFAEAEAALQKAKISSILKGLVTLRGKR